VNDTFLAGTLRNDAGDWLFSKDPRDPGSWWRRHDEYPNGRAAA
jgi:hypothetical protein